MHMLAVTETKGFHLDPRTKLLLMAVVATAEFLYGHTAFMLAVALIPFILLLTNRQYKAAAIFIVLFVAALVVKENPKLNSFSHGCQYDCSFIGGIGFKAFSCFCNGELHN